MCVAPYGSESCAYISAKEEAKKVTNAATHISASFHASPSSGLPPDCKYMGTNRMAAAATKGISATPEMANFVV